MSFLMKVVARSYAKRGWQVFSNELDQYEKIPHDWIGPKPELVVQRGRTVGAVCIESSETLNYPNVTEKWRSLIEKNHAELTIVVKDHDCMERVKTLAYNAGIPATVRMMKKMHRKTSSKRWGGAWRDSKIDWIIIGTVVLILLGFSIMFVPGFLSKFKMKTFYQPFGRERQEQILKDREKQDAGKSEAEKSARRREDLKMKKEYDKLKEQYKDLK